MQPEIEVISEAAAEPQTPRKITDARQRRNKLERERDAAQRALSTLTGKRPELALAVRTNPKKCDDLVALDTAIEKAEREYRDVSDAFIGSHAKLLTLQRAQHQRQQREINARINEAGTQREQLAKEVEQHLEAAADALQAMSEAADEIILAGGRPGEVWNEVRPEQLPKTLTAYLFTLFGRSADINYLASFARQIRRGEFAAIQRGAHLPYLLPESTYEETDAG